MSRCTKMGPGGNITTNGQMYIFNKNTGQGVGTSSRFQRPQNRCASFCKTIVPGCASMIEGDVSATMTTSGMDPLLFRYSDDGGFNNDDGYAYLPMTGMDYYFFGTNYGNSDGTTPTTSMYMSTNYAFGFGAGSIDFTEWSINNPAILFDHYDSYNFNTYVSPPQDGSAGVKYVRIVATGTDFQNDDLTTLKKAYEIYYVRDVCYQYMQFNCSVQEVDRTQYTDSNISNIIGESTFQNTFGSFGDNPSNSEGPQSGGSYVIRSDLQGRNWQFFPHFHLVL